jgi:protein involved in polysaccharide export with SLBB domain
MMSLRRAALAAAFACCAAPLIAQESGSWDPGRTQVSRQALEELLAQLDQSANSPVYSGRLRDRARREAALIRQRLEEGDFQVGDRISLSVEGEQRLNDTFTVETGRVLVLPQIGEIALAGVLRSELNDYLTRRLGQFIRSPVIQSRSLVRVAIMGAVGRPGFYTVPTSILMEDVLNTAGGPSPQAKLLEIRIERGEQRIWDGEALQAAITEGRTLDYLGLRAGDRVLVPQGGRGLSTESRIRILTLLLTVPGLILGLTRIF